MDRVTRRSKPPARPWRAVISRSSGHQRPPATQPPVRLHFLVPGISKCGTTTLCALLNQHPQLFLPNEQIRDRDPRSKYESMFFCRDDYQKWWHDYAALFTNAPDGSLLGEGSTLYTVTDHEVAARDRIVAHYPDIRMIFIVRDPIERIESSFQELHHSGWRFGAGCPHALDEALNRLPGLLEDTRYRRRIDTYAAKVASDRILVVFADELFDAPWTLARRCFEFLGVDPDVPLVDPSVHLNSGATKLFDTQEMRLMRRKLVRPRTAFPLSRVRLRTQDQFLVPLGLRKPFDGGPLHWPEARQLVVDELADDTARFLAAHGKALYFWPRFAAACRGEWLDGQAIP